MKIKQSEVNGQSNSNPWLRIENWAIGFCLRLLTIFGIKTAAGFERTLREFIRFGIVGISNTLIAYGLYALFLYLLRLGGQKFIYDYLIASVASYMLSILWAYFWNAKIVFKSERDAKEMLKALLRSYLSYGFSGFIVTNLILFLLVQKLQISAYIAFLVVLLVTVPLNFIMNKFWAFKIKS